MLRVKAIAPLRLDAAELARRQLRYARLGGTELQITLVNLDGDGAPAALDSAADIAASERLTAAEIGRTDPADFDVAMPDCVLDPAVGRDDRGQTPVPVVGMLRLTAGHLASLGHRFAAVTRNRVIAAELARKLGDYGLAGSLEAVHVLDADFCLIADGPGWAESISAARARTAETGAGALLNGCSAVDVDPRAGGPVPVVDPAALALSLLTVAARAGLARPAVG